MSAQTCSTGLAPVPDLTKAVDAMAALTKKMADGDWILMAPDGRVWAGKRPLQLAAVAMGDSFNPLEMARDDPAL